MPFRPKVNNYIEITNQKYYFSEHPAAKGMPYGQTGRRATVYQVRDKDNNLFALKIFTLSFQTPQIEKNAEKINAYSSLPGLQACQRMVITPQNNTSLLQNYSDLKYSVLMPSMNGINWQEIILSRQPLSPDQSISIANDLVNILFTMEKKGIAHCDLSGPNLIVNVSNEKTSPSAFLIDLEEMYSPDHEKPQKLPGGSAGYAHQSVKNSIWSNVADRFSGGILIAEILGWCDEKVRRIAFGEQYFSINDMQSSDDRFIILSKVLRDRWGDQIADTFQKAWYATKLSECPSFSDWLRAFSPVPEPDELRSQLHRMERLGRWGDVIQLCDQLLEISEDQYNIWSAQSRAQQLKENDAKIEQTW